MKNLKAQLARLTSWAERTAYRASIVVAKVFIALCVIAATLIFLYLVLHFAGTFQFQALGLAVITPLALLVALASLLYSRCRAIVSKAKRFRTFYVAERFFAASILYGTAVLSGLLITAVLTALKEGSSFPTEGGLIIWYLLPIFFAVLAFIEVIQALLAVPGRLFTWNRHRKTMVRSIRRFERHH